MKFEEAIAALRAGKKVRNTGWEKNEYVYLTADEGILNEVNESYGFPSFCLDVDEEWELYEEPIELKACPMTFAEACKLAHFTADQIEAMGGKYLPIYEKLPCKHYWLFPDGSKGYFYYLDFVVIE